MLLFYFWYFLGLYFKFNIKRKIHNFFDLISDMLGVLI